MRQTAVGLVGLAAAGRIVFGIVSVRDGHDETRECLADAVAEYQQLLDDIVDGLREGTVESANGAAPRVQQTALLLGIAREDGTTLNLEVPPPITAARLAEAGLCGGSS